MLGSSLDVTSTWSSICFSFRMFLLHRFTMRFCYRIATVMPNNKTMIYIDDTRSCRVRFSCPYYRGVEKMGIHAISDRFAKAVCCSQFTQWGICLQNYQTDVCYI